MKVGISLGSALLVNFLKSNIKHYFHGNFDRQPLKIQSGLFHTILLICKG